MWHTDGQTDRWTDILPRHSPRYAYASCGKNQPYTHIQLHSVTVMSHSHLHIYLPWRLKTGTHSVTVMSHSHLHIYLPWRLKTGTHSVTVMSHSHLHIYLPWRLIHRYTFSYRDVSFSPAAFDACSTAVSSPPCLRYQSDCLSWHYQSPDASSSGCYLLATKHTSKKQLCAEYQSINHLICLLKM